MLIEAWIQHRSKHGGAVGNRLIRFPFAAPALPKGLRKAALAVPVALIPFHAACEECDAGIDFRSGTITVRMDNDLFGGSHQDQGYSNGLQVAVVSPGVQDHVADSCPRQRPGWPNGFLDLFQLDGYDQRQMVVSLSHLLYTPSDNRRADLVKEDRPYVGVLLASVGYSARKENSLRANHLRFGIIGPAAGGREVQDASHTLMGIERFNGWSNQLHNEPVFQWIHERMHRRAITGADNSASLFDQDLVGHWGGALGSFGTYANAGLEWRIGWRLPDDFGSAVWRPAGEGIASIRNKPSGQPWRGHFFAGLDAKWVVRDITLDGNTFGSSHSVEKKPLVAEMAIGVVISRGMWKFAFTRYSRSREFHGQRERPVFAGFAVSKVY